ncbi:hypothetical protein NPA31_011905 [Aurantimonas sp. MSK8Z-1]|uniref:hypothetical protein n=1 Tax=Mangrovibrevibacter kandeliae TaxID=2968473 RepID=UPI002118841A|nr:hypothetical protein [Aurantimonas sp. MSK8Z-1]MCW4115668.1 hypothetical protein [Aurantimonas sp. MSK8Z-1]
MQTASILLALGGDSGNTVPKYDVTAAEVALLMAIHGAQAVTEVEPKGDVKRSNREELRRLHSVYDKARDNANQCYVDQLFPGAAARVFESFDELELPPELYKAQTRVSPDSTAASAPAAGKALGDMTKAELLDEAKRRGVDVQTSDSKAEILAALQGGAGTDPEDGVEDMSDGSALD